MHLARLNRLRRAVAYAGLAALFALVTMVLSQCTMVGDNLTGTSLSRAERATCIQNCKDTREMCIAQAAHDCGGTNNACFETAHALCQEQFKVCKNSCHKQGAGFAG